MPGPNTKWEYKTIHRRHPCAMKDEDLNRLGNDHWELAGIIHYTGTVIGSPPKKIAFVFKREKRAGGGRGGGRDDD